MANSFAHALMGGIGAVGNAYAEEQKKQRDYNLEQQKARSEMARQENFARFKQGLQHETMALQQTQAQETYASQQAEADKYRKSGQVDPTTGRELTKQEAAEYKGAEPLVNKADWDAEQKTQRALDSDKTVSDAKIKQAKEMLDAGEITQEEYDATVKKVKGISQPAGGTLAMTAKDIKKELGTFRRAKSKGMSDMKTEYGKEYSNLATLYSTQNALANLSEESINKLVKDGDQDVINALVLPDIINSMIGWSKMEVKDELEKKRIGGKPLTSAQKKIVMDGLEVDDSFAGFFQRSTKPKQ